MSWEELRSNGIAEVSEISEEIDRKILRIFSTKDGQEVLEYYRKKTLDQPSFYPGEDASFGYLREGQNHIIRDIINRIKKGREY